MTAGRASRSCAFPGPKRRRWSSTPCPNPLIIQEQESASWREIRTWWPASKDSALRSITALTCRYSTERWQRSTVPTRWWRTSVRNIREEEIRSAAACVRSAGRWRTAKGRCSPGRRFRQAIRTTWRLSWSWWRRAACCVHRAAASALSEKGMCGLPWRCRLRR